MSDIILSTGEPAWLRREGEWARASRRPFETEELSSILIQMSGNQAAASLVGSGLDLDFGYQIGEGRAQRLRYRANASAVACGWGTGLSITLRAIPSAPPDLSELGLEEDLSKAFFPQSGLVLVTGVMGSGKSTLLASVLRRLSETQARHIATYEAPIEFDLRGSPCRLSPVEQSEVPRHIPGFLEAAKNLTRRAADVVLVGESRDPETLRGLLEAAELGVAAYTTLHTGSVAEAPYRILNAFPPGERQAAAASLFSTLRLVVQQRLLKKPGGGRQAVREFLALNRSMRERLQGASFGQIGPALELMVAEKGQSLLQAAQRAAREGLITEEAYAAVLSEKGRAGL
jgi:defect-in-organelle-trafficking protein DotB